MRSQITAQPVYDTFLINICDCVPLTISAMSKSSTSSTLVEEKSEKRTRRSSFSRFSIWLCYSSQDDSDASCRSLYREATFSDNCAIAYSSFLHDFPEYRLTHTWDFFRSRDYTWLQRNRETYLNHTGATPYPEPHTASHRLPQ